MNLDSPANRLLISLDKADFALLAPHLRTVPLVQGQVLQEQETRVEQVYFPLSGVVSLISVMQGGEVVETATIGREGAVGAFGGLGPWNAFSRAVVRLPGTAAVMSVAHFQAAVGQSDRIRNLILRYKEALLAQVQQTTSGPVVAPDLGSDGGSQASADPGFHGPDAGGAKNNRHADRGPTAGSRPDQLPSRSSRRAR